MPVITAPTKFLSSRISATIESRISLNNIKKKLFLFADFRFFVHVVGSNYQAALSNPGGIGGSCQMEG